MNTQTEMEIIHGVAWAHLSREESFERGSRKPGIMLYYSKLPCLDAIVVCLSMP